MIILVFGVVTIWLVMFGALAILPLVVEGGSQRGRRLRLPLELPTPEIETGVDVSPHNQRAA